ncbi:sugar ABC transporter permease [Paenibacillus alginolyticus]|uniref:sugar ABC transporter permease n=1 Tax=Paenibacillus alginolyticus TaxID=59839 RepID=UPI000428E005|nr:sugar ABC transporter permease [Paenibacillus alginolyticus]MCY9665782.1 sugar ABC transporter permease [Paenibacillus alginolyticus]
MENKLTGTSVIPKGQLMNKIDIRSYAMIAGLIILWIMFSIFTDGTFLSARNISNLTIQMSVVSILATGMVLIIVTGNIDLSVGSLVGLAGGVAAALMAWEGWGTTPTILAVLLLGVIIGGIQGYATVFLNIPSFIVTLGGMMLFKGILIGITKGVSIAPMNPSYKVLGDHYVNNIIGIILTVLAITSVIYNAIKKRNSRKKNALELESAFKTVMRVSLIVGLIIIFYIAMYSYKGFPIPVLIMLGLLLLFSFIAGNTKFGRYIYAIGGNIQATKYSGINVKKIVLIVFMLNGLVAAIAGIVLSARLNAGAPSSGNMMELDAIAAAVIGGTSLMGGKGKVVGAILGALIMASLDNGMSLLNMEAFWQYIVKGLILVLAVWFDVMTKNKSV